MLSSINSMNFNTNRNTNIGVIPPMKPNLRSKSDSVSFGMKQPRITPVFNKEFSSLYKKMMNFFEKNPDIKSIENSFGQNHKITISQRIAPSGTSIICDVKEIKKATAAREGSISGVRYTLKHSGNTRKQNIKGFNHNFPDMFDFSGPKQYIGDEKEGKIVIDAIISMLNQKMDELNELCRLGKRAVYEPPDTRPKIEHWSEKYLKAYAKNQKLEDQQPKNQAKTNILKRLVRKCSDYLFP